MKESNTHSGNFFVQNDLLSGGNLHASGQSIAPSDSRQTTHILSSSNISNGIFSGHASPGTIIHR